MKKKNLVLVGIAVCTILLASPVLASAGYSKIYGNANEDDTLDMRDVTYIKLVIFGKKPATDFADANYDGKVSMLDIGQTKLIILGKEKEITVVDSADRIVTVKKPVERIVVLNSDAAEAVQILDAVDKVVGVSTSVFKKSYYFPEMVKRTSIGKWNEPNYEAIIELNPDIVIGYVKWPPITEVEEKLDPAGITAIALDFYKQDILREEVEKLGYILNKKERAERYNEWCSNINCCNHLSCGQKRFPLFEFIFALEFKPQDLILEPWYF